MAGLIINDSDNASCACAERILRSGVGVATRAQDADVQGRIIRRAPDLVQVAVVGAEQGAYRAMGSDAGCAARRINVAGQGSGGQRWRCRNAKQVGKTKSARHETQRSNAY